MDTKQNYRKNIWIQSIIIIYDGKYIKFGKLVLIATSNPKNQIKNLHDQISIWNKYSEPK